MFKPEAKQICGAFYFLIAGLIADKPALAQVHVGAIETLAPVQLAQSPVPSLFPTDVTPTPIGPERALFKPGPTYYFYKKLPERLWFNVSAEVSQRYESNVYQTKNDYKSDYVFRVLPNISLGYNVLNHTSVYTNYFLLKDVFADNRQLTFPTTQSVSLGVRQDVTLRPDTLLQFDFQSRELWQSVKVRQADLIPGVTLTKTLTPRTVVFANALLQMRGGNYFVAPTRELDPFYSIGMLHSHGNWVLSTVGTLVTNFRHPTFAYSIPDYSNNSIILDAEISHPVSAKYPSLVAFIRVEPIWNWDSHGFPGISGFDFRLFGGLRTTFVKPAYHESLHKMKRQLEQSNESSTGSTTPGAVPSSEAPPAKSSNFGVDPSVIPTSPANVKSEGGTTDDNMPPENELRPSIEPPTANLPAKDTEVEIDSAGSSSPAENDLHPPIEPPTANELHPPIDEPPTAEALPQSTPSESQAPYSLGTIETAAKAKTSTESIPAEKIPEFKIDTAINSTPVDAADIPPPEAESLTPIEPPVSSAPQSVPDKSATSIDGNTLGATPAIPESSSSNNLDPTKAVLSASAKL